MTVYRWLQKFLPARKLDEIHDLDGWRTYYIRLMLLLGLVALPIGLAFSLPTYIREHAYVLIFFDMAVTLVILLSLIFWQRISPVKIFFLLLYGMSLTFIINLGPYYARPAWLVMCVVSAAFLFGVRAAIITTAINALVLTALYFYAAPFLPAWSLPHQEPPGKWMMFCANISLLSLMSGIPVGFLLNRMNSLLAEEQTLRRRLTVESKELQLINQRLEAEIAERIRAEEENRRLQTELVQAQKMEAMGTLAGGIAHDFNNILSAIIGYGQLVQDDPSQSAKSRQNIEKLLKAGERARTLVQQILAFSRKADSSIEPLDLAENVSDALQMMRTLIPANVKLQVHLAGPCMVMSSSTFIHQILMNLFTNALHAMGAEGGALEIELAAVLLSEAKTKTLKIPPGRYARLSVSDTGCGMTPELVERIFEPYFTTKGMGSGTGLGLSVVHGIVKSHGGAIVCRSVPAQGTSFEIYLPILPAAPRMETPPPADKKSPPSRIPTGKETILYVDDESMLADMSDQMLKKLGYNVVIKTDSVEALTLFCEAPARFDAVITDMSMPNLTGDKLARKILDIRPDIPIIICTGYSEYMSDEDASRLGIRDFLMKPYTIDQLAGVLRKAIDGAPDTRKQTP